MTNLADFFKPSWKLTPEQNNKLRRLAVYTALAVVLVVLAVAGAHAGESGDAGSPSWETVIYAKLFLARLVGGVGAITLSVVMGCIEWLAMDNTELGRRLWVWDEKDPIMVKAYKKRNAASVLCALILMNALVLGQAVR